MNLNWNLCILDLHPTKSCIVVDFDIKTNTKHVKNQRSSYFEGPHQHNFQYLGHRLGFPRLPVGFPALLQALPLGRLHQDGPPVYEPGAGSLVFWGRTVN